MNNTTQELTTREKLVQALKDADEAFRRFTRLNITVWERLPAYRTKRQLSCAVEAKYHFMGCVEYVQVLQKLVESEERNEREV